MAQFDVCRNLGQRRDGFPYLVVVQSGEFDRSVRRLVVPLIEVTGHPVLTPIFTIEGRQVVADALLMFSLPREKLGPVVASLADDQAATAIIASIDQVISRAYG